MTWIRTIPESQATTELHGLYDRVRDPGGGQIDAIMHVHSLNPRGLKAHFELYSAVMAGTPTLRKAEREMIALVVSVINECHY